MKHIGWIDYAKTFAIYSVVLLHTHCDATLTVVINAYVMPLFFFLSGFLFSRERNPEFVPFLKKRFRQLIIPYLWINALAYLLWVFALRHYGSQESDLLQWHEPLLAVLLGIPRNLAHDIPLWSILCFFVVEMVYYACPHRWKWNDLTIAGIGCVAASIVSLMAGREGLDLPLALAPASQAIAFYALGHFAAENAGTISFLFRPSIPVLLFGIVLLAAGYDLNTPTAFFLGIFGNPAYFIIGAIGGIILGIQIAMWLEKIFSDRGVVRMVSRGTLLICGFHLPVFAFMKGVMLFGFGIAPEVLTDGIIRGNLFAIVASALCLPIIVLIERHLRFLVSK